MTFYCRFNRKRYDLGGLTRTSTRVRREAAVDAPVMIRELFLKPYVFREGI